MESGSIRFVEGEKFKWQGREWLIKDSRANGKVTLVDQATGEVQDEDRLTLVEALFSGKLRVTTTAEKGSTKNRQRNNTPLDLSDYPPQLVAVAKYRLRVIEPLLAADSEVSSHKVLTNDEVKSRVGEIQKEHGKEPAAVANTGDETLGNKKKGPLIESVSERSIRSWLSIYEGRDRVLASLIPNVGKRARGSHMPHKTRLEVIVSNVIDEIYMVRAEISANKVHREVAVRVEEANVNLPPDEKLKTPSIRTIQRRINNLDAREVMTVKAGTRAAERAFAQYGQVLYPEQALAEAEMDNAFTNLIVIDDEDNLPIGRLHYTKSIDLASRYPLGLYMGFGAPSSVSALGCLLHMISPKGDLMKRYPGLQHQWLAYGIPAKLRVDNGADFTSKAFRDACEALGIVLEYTPAYRPESKPTIERSFGTDNSFFHSLPGTTFSNLIERGDYDSEGDACVLLSELDAMIHIYLLDIYAESSHRGLNGGIPARRWEKLTSGLFTPRLPFNADELQALVGLTEMRVVHRYGVEIANLRYNDDALGPLRVALEGAQTKVKINPSDLGVVQVHDPFNERYIPVRALNYEYASGKSLAKHLIIAEHARNLDGEVNPVSLGLAEREIQKRVETGRASKQKTLAARTQAARFESDGQSISSFSIQDGWGKASARRAEERDNEGDEIAAVVEALDVERQNAALAADTTNTVAETDATSLASPKQAAQDEDEWGYDYVPAKR
jgi:putative transposase